MPLAVTATGVARLGRASDSRSPFTAAKVVCAFGARSGAEVI